MADEKFLYAREAQVVYEKRSIADGVRMKGSRVEDSKAGGLHIRHAIERHGEPTVERFVCLALDSRSHVIGWHTVATGTSTFVAVGIPEIFRFPILCGAAAIIVGHNHPSGDPSPSPEDVALTARVAESSKLLGIRLLDHIIIGRGSQFSFLDSGILHGFAGSK